MTRPPRTLPPGLLDASPSETTPTLLELTARQAAARSPADLLAQYDRDAYVHPAPLDQRLVHRLDGLALAAAPDYEALLLAPVAPLGTCSVVTPAGQDRVLSTTRGTEVVSDPTNLLALECAARLRRDPAAHVRLCTVHQVVRAQPLPPGKGFTRHFRMFAIVDAGRGRPDDAFEVDAVRAQAQAFARLFDACAAATGARFADRHLTVRADREPLGDRVAAALTAALPAFTLSREGLDAPYYDGLRVLVSARARNGAVIPIADIGRFDWAATLCAHRKQRFVAGGFGLQLVPLAY